MSRDFKLIADSFRLVKEYKFKFICTLISILVEIGIGLIQPILWGVILRELFLENYEKIAIYIIELSLIYILQSIIMFLKSYLFSYLNENIICDVKILLYNKILNLPLKAFDEMGSGDILSRLEGDIPVIADIITNQLLNSIVDILKVVVVGIMVFYISIQLSITVLLFFPLSYSIFFIFGKMLRKKNELLRHNSDEYFSLVDQSVNGIKEIKSLGLKNYNFNMFKRLVEKGKSLGIQIGKLSSMATSICELGNFFSQIAIFSLGVYLIYKHTLKIEYFIAFSSYSTIFSTSLINITQLNSKIQQTLVSLERIFNIINDFSYNHEQFGTDYIDVVKGSICFENIKFRYGDDLILNDISFNINEGKKLAIVGESGSGKTTILNLLLGLYTNFTGSIYIDNNNISNISEESLRKNICVVSQELILFNLTIKENLLISNPKASMKQIENACRAACIHEYIMSLKDGYNSMISENSINLSPGQKQKIGIARALLKNTKIILFDEVTSALDNNSQFFVKEAINRLLPEHTVIVIAHRLTNVLDADKIIVLRNGTIIAEGNHEFLLKNDIYYRELYKKEFYRGKKVNPNKIYGY